MAQVGSQFNIQDLLGSLSGGGGQALQNVLGSIGNLAQNYRPQQENPFLDYNIVSNGADASIINPMLQAQSQGRQARTVMQDDMRTREQELAMRKAERARQIQLENEKRQRELEQKQRLGQILSNPEVLGNLSRNLNLPPELLMGVNPEDLGALGQLGQMVAQPSEMEQIQLENARLEQKQLRNQLSTRPQRRIIEQGGVNYYVDTGEPVIPSNVTDMNATQIPMDLPQNIPDPLAGFRDKDKAQIEFLKQSEEKIAKIEEALSQEEQVTQRLQRFLELQDVQATGASQFKTPFVGYLDPELQEMEAIQSEIAPKMRQVGSGSSSDRDVEMFKKATVSPKNKPQTNKNIATARIAAAENKKDMAQFMRAFQASYGHTKGAEKSWRDYLEHNPIFDDRTQKEQFKLNENRVDYRDYFAIKNAQIPFSNKEEVKQAFKAGKIDAGLAANILKIHFGMK